MSSDVLYRVIVTRKKTELNPNYRYYTGDEPRYFVTDETYENVSKPYKTKGAAKGERTRIAGYSPDTFVSATIQKAELVWQTLTEEEL